MMLRLTAGDPGDIELVGIPLARSSRPSRRHLKIQDRAPFLLTCK